MTFHVVPGFARVWVPRHRLRSSGLPPSDLQAGTRSD